MKRVFSLAALMAASTFAVAQGRIQFLNDSLHLVYFDSDTSFLHLADVPLAGQPVPGTGGVTPSGATLVADLWAGTSPFTLFKVTTVGLGIVPGRLVPANVTLPSGLPGGVPTYFQIQVYDQAAGSAIQAWAGLLYFGLSPVFTAVPGSATPYSLVQSVAPSYSTWAPGAFPLAGANRGAIMVGADLPWPPNSPEPSGFALLELGGAGMLLLRRRQRNLPNWPIRDVGADATRAGSR